MNWHKTPLAAARLTWRWCYCAAMRGTTIIRFGVLGLVLLHLVALLAPGALWGVSHGAVWPLPWVLAWLAAALAACVAAPRGAARLFLPAFPGRRGAAAVAGVAGLAFWLLRQRTHFMGDGYLLIRDEGYSETVTRARFLVEVTNRSVRAAQAHLGLATETTLALLAVLAGVAATYALLRTAAHLGTDRLRRWVLAAFLGTAGALQLFCGHVEYYGVVAAALAVYLALVTRSLGSSHPGWTWAALAAYGTLVPLHLSTLALAPAHAYLLGRAWRSGSRRAVLAAVAALPVLAWLLLGLGRQTDASFAAAAWAGLRRYTEPYFADTSARHAFALFSGAHWLAVVNDVLCAAPLALLSLPLACLRPQPGDAPAARAARRFLGLAALGSVAVNLLFARELGPYRDWDILAPYGFVLLAGTGMLALSRGAAAPSTLVLVAVGGVYHTLPWVLTQASPRAALAHVERVLEAPHQWSPHARAYMHEELAIYHRARGDRERSTREYSAAVQANPADARYHVGLGNQHAQDGRMQEAVQEYRAALERRPDYAPAHNNLAFALASLGQDLERARGHARRALQAEPQNADYWLTLGRVEVAAGQRGAARTAVEQALRLRQDFAPALQLLQSLETE